MVDSTLFIVDGRPNSPAARGRGHQGPSTLNYLPCAILILLLASSCAPATFPADVDARWYRGNLHTHSLWSDGDDYPEMIVEWYRDHGYDFLAISDHNTIMEGQKWVALPDSGKGLRAFDRYLDRFGDSWVETRLVDGGREVRLKNFDAIHDRLAVAGRFVLIRSEEISDGYGGKPVHLNATNLAEYIAPQGGESVLEVMQNNVDAVLAQREATGRAMFPHINHPNFVYAVTAEDLVALEGDQFFEVYNGHPLVNNHGDDAHPSTEEIWDYVLTRRLADGRGILYGLATDDAHHYHEQQANRANAGRGWVMVRAPRLDEASIVSALEAGDFYATTGVVLRDVSFSDETLRVAVEPEADVSYRIQFIGTRRGEPGTTEAADAASPAMASSRAGALLRETSGTSATYRMEGDELYVRARVLSSRIKINGHEPDEREMAWTQPVTPDRRNRDSQ